MPRSNKKKDWSKPPLKSPPHQMAITSESSLIEKERQLMIDRGRASALKHGLSLDPGSVSSADGNCAFHAALSNVNERSCFKEKFPLSQDYYIAYNLSHYESLIPKSCYDVRKSIDLVNNYLTGQYRLGKQDLPQLLGITTTMENPNERGECEKIEARPNVKVKI